MNIEHCILCGQELTDEQKKDKRVKYCSEEHRRMREKQINKPYYLDYHREYQRKLRSKIRKNKKFCHNCGKPLPKYRTKFCSQSCITLYNQYDPSNIKYQEMPTMKRIKCEECEGELMEIGREQVCKVCGLVQE
jgi:hypothetical protein